MLLSQFLPALFLPSYHVFVLYVCVSISALQKKIMYTIFIISTYISTRVLIAVQSLSHVQLCDPMGCSMPGFPVLHHLLELAQSCIRWVGDGIQPYINIWHFFSFWITLLCMTLSRSIHVSTNNSILLLVIAEQYCMVCIYHIFFTYSSVDGHLGWFHVLAIVNSVAMHDGVHVSFWIMVFSGDRPRRGLLGNTAALFLVF